MPLCGFYMWVLYIRVHIILCFSRLNQKTQIFHLMILMVVRALSRNTFNLLHVAIAAANLLSTSRWLFALSESSVPKYIASCFRGTSVPSRYLTIDCFWWSVRSMNLSYSNSNSDRSMRIPAVLRAKNYWLIGYVSQKSKYHLHRGLLHIVCLSWVPVALLCWVWIWDLERGPPQEVSIGMVIGGILGGCLTLVFLPGGDSFSCNSKFWVIVHVSY